MKKTIKKKAIKIYLSPDTEDRLRKHCDESKIQYSSFVERIINEFFDDTDDHGMILKKMDRMTYLIRNQQAIGHIHFEAFGLWLRYYFLHTADIPEEGKLAAWTDGNLKYSKFMDYLIRHIEDGHKWKDEFIEPIYKGDL
jgi:hypothetical protein